MPEKNNDLAWRIGGPQGSGVDTAATIFARACAAGGLELYGRREYYSNIMGRHSYYDVRVDKELPTCHRGDVDLLTTFEAETLARHALAVTEGGGIIYDAGDGDVSLDELQFLDDRLKTELGTYLDSNGLSHSTKGLLEDAERRGVRTFSIPLGELLKRLSESQEISQSIADRTRNTMAVAISTAVLGYDAEYLQKAIASVFSGRDKIIQLNKPAVELAYEYVRDNLETEELTLSLSSAPNQEERIIVNGNQASALGKIAGGLAFQTYYPISPATDESVYLEGHDTFSTADGENGYVAVVQTEDELAAATMAIGAALTGVRSATATSGPGFSLMAEALGWAGINEVPVVITLYQRGSPSTGMPTRSEQGDLQFALRAGHGEFPRIVLASGDVDEAFYDAAQAFNYAERYQTPVIHLLDKAIASTTQTLPPFQVDRVTIDRGEIYSPEDDRRESDKPFPRFEPTRSGISPRAVFGQQAGAHWLTGGEHTRLGRVTEDPTTREEQVEKRARKLETALKEISQSEKLAVYGKEDAGLTILSWGSNKGVIREAIARLDSRGIEARLIQVRLLSPFPTEEVERLLEGASATVVVEANFSGQFAALLRENTGRPADHLVTKYNGRPIGANELTEALAEIADGDAESRVVLRNPWE